MNTKEVEIHSADPEYPNRRWDVPPPGTPLAFGETLFTLTKDVDPALIAALNNIADAIREQTEANRQGWEARRKALEDMRYPAVDC